MVSCELFSLIGSFRNCFDAYGKERTCTDFVICNIFDNLVYNFNN